jgi:hypothetical protein
MTVVGAPKYAVVLATESVDVPLHGHISHMLESGAYGAFFETWAAPTTLHRSKEAIIDLSESVARHNEANAGASELASAQSFSTVPSRDAFFVVE